MTFVLVGRYRTGGAWALLTVGVALTASVIRTLVVARLLGPHEIGTMAIALIALGFIDAVSSTGIDAALVSQPGDVERDLDPAFTLQALRGAVVTFVLWTLAPLVASMFGNAGAVPVIRAVSLVAFIRGFASPAVALVVRRIDFRRMFWWSLPETLAGVGLAVWFAVLRGDVWALVIGVLGGQLVGTTASYLLAPRRPRMAFRREALDRLLHFGKWVSGSRTLSHLSNTADAAVVGLVHGTSALGYYQFASRIAELPVLTFTRAVGQVALPGFSELQDNPRRLQHISWSALRLVLAVHGAFALAILLLADVAVERLVGPRWLPSVPVLRILAFAIIFRSIVVIATQLFYAARQPRLTLVVNAVRTAVLAAAIGPLMLAYGVPGAAVAALLSAASAAALSWRLMRRMQVESGSVVGPAGQPERR